ncbi:hypothetical protein KO527_17545 [Pseudoalteromonas sp. C2R02]|uniref:hypothetical protein n=1 Tax=Pseudoalteromonas sp. C2R02 TaxID=2841565 RepID=UPI001C08FAD4|nr:hypothetical protein [Pseudoalteromonas sp. C2R02]MBU2971150.1 hypothetical protein [Pseudoalteromonas sp. C2R02]
MEDLVNFLTTIHADKATNSNKDQNKQASETTVKKEMKKTNQKIKYGIKSNADKIEIAEK